MQSLWNDVDAQPLEDDPLALRVYTSQLLGRNPALVLHGGGNTSVKGSQRDLFGVEEAVLYVKGSGWDLATIEKPGFAPVRLKTLLQMAELETLSDSDMVKHQRAAMLDPNAPNPSVETILHALIPFKFVDHTHADSVVTLTNSARGEERIRTLYGDSVVIIPYVMPGFILAKTVHQIMQGRDWQGIDALILMNHGVFTFHDDARTAYEKMIDVVTRAEESLRSHGVYSEPIRTQSDALLPAEDLLTLADLRQSAGRRRGTSVLARLNHHAAAVEFSRLDGIESVATRGPLTPDHSIRTKRIPVVLSDSIEESLQEYAVRYRAYFDAHAKGETMLDPAPRWAVWPGRGTVSLGVSVSECRIIEDISNHTLNAIGMAERLDSWRPLDEQEIFDVEYWELEQAKLAKGGALPEFAGHVALVTGAASGIGRACAELLNAQGAAVIALDIDAAIGAQSSDRLLGIQCDATDSTQLEAALARGIQTFGGIDIVVSNVGLFPTGCSIAEMDDEGWRRALDVNLTSHMALWRRCIPFLQRSLNPSITVIASKNVPAPGPNAAAYSVSKAGLTQLARVAALELGQDGIRVNTVHPNGVFDTRLWSQELLAARAASYEISVDEYKRNNLLHTEVTSVDVARVVCQLAGRNFSKSTGAQIAIDGGNERVI